MVDDTRCSVDNCELHIRNKKRVLCNMHYLRFMRHGDLDYDKNIKIARFWAKVHKSSGCWEWLGSKTVAGYGQVQQEGRKIYAYRYSYALEHGSIPGNLPLDHFCRNRGCVRPSHLEAVSSVENVLRGEGPTAINARKTHCKRNHPLSGDNLYVVKATGYRQCKTCYKIRRTNDA